MWTPQLPPEPRAQTVETGGREDSGKQLKAGDTSGLETMKLVRTYIHTYTGSGWGTVAGCYEYCNEHLSPWKAGVSLLAERSTFSQGG